MAAEGQALSQGAAGQAQQEAAQGQAESAKEAALALPAAGEAAPAPLAMAGGAQAASGAGLGLEGATSAALAQVESAYAQAENAPDKAPVTPQEDAGYTASLGAAQAVGEAQQTHKAASGAASEAQAAAESPSAELEGQAQTAQVGKLEQTEAPAFDGAAFKAALKAKIAELAPKSADEADNLKESGKVDTVKGEMQGQVNEEQTASQGPLEEASKEAPDMNAADPKSVTPLEAASPAPAPSEIGADKAVPKPKGQGEVETPIAESNKALDQQMADAEITPQQLQNSNEPEFASALSAKDEAQAQAEQGVQAYRQGEQAQISSAEAEAVSAAQAATQGMFDTRTNMLAQAEGQQQQSKSEDEKAREKVASDISAIYEKSKSKVEQTLSELDGKVTSVFDEGAKAASKIFEDFVDAKMEAYKEERYGGLLGWAAWAKDKLMGMPSEVNGFYAEGRQLYIAKMDAVIDNVVAIISATLAKAKAEIANGKREIQAYVDQLPEELKQVGQEATQEIQGKFDELEQQVNDKQGELIDSLAQKYNDNLQAVDARIDELKAANKGLVDKVLDAVGGVIQKILALKRMLEGVLARAQAAIKQIIADPIGFLGNLIKAVKEGFNQFVEKIGTHLSKGLISWLTGTLAQAGIKLPDTFDLQGIFQLVMQVAGISFDQIIGKLGGALGIDLNSFIEPVMQVINIYQEEGFAGLVKSGLAQIIGEENVSALIEVVDMVKMVISGNFGALWELVKEHLSGLKEMVMGQIEELVTKEVIEAGAKFVLSLFNPAGAFIKACMMIYDVVMFFVNNGSKIMALVNAVVDSVASIANGDIGAAANAIEQALARSIPVAIGFLASLLGLGDLPEKIKGVIQSVRKAVDNAIDKILDLPPVKMIMGFIKKLIDKVKGLVAKGIDKAKDALGFGSKKQGSGPNGEYTEADKQTGLAAIDQEEQHHIENEKISKKDALAVAATVKQKHPVFKSIKVIDGKDSWDYNYQLQRAIKEGEPKIAGLGNLSDDELLRIIRRVAQRVYENPEVIESANKISDSERYTQEMTQSGEKRRKKTLLTATPRGAGMVGRARYLRERGRLGLGQREQTTIREGSSEIDVGSRQSWGKEAIVEGAGTYDQLAEKLEATGQSPTRISAAIRTFIRTGQVPSKLQAHEDVISEAGLLMAGTEGARNPAALVSVPMVLDAMAKGDSVSNAFKRFPMYPTGAAEIADTVNEQLSDDSNDYTGFMSKPDRAGRASGVKTAQWKETEVKLAVEWINNRMKQQGVAKFDTVEQLEAFVASETMQFYDIRDK
jgi:hypothetical protein